MKVEADRFKNLEYSEPTFQTEAKAVLGEYHKNAARPELRMEEKLRETAFTQHTYRHTTLGYYADIQKMPEYYEYSKQFFERWYTPDNVMLFVVGDFDDAKLMSWVKASYGDWKGKSAVVQIPVEPKQNQDKRRPHRLDRADAPAPPARLAHPGHDGRLDRGRRSSKSWARTSPARPRRSTRSSCSTSSSSSRSRPARTSPATRSCSPSPPRSRTRRTARRCAPRSTSRSRDLVTGKLDKKRLEAVKQNLRYGLLMGLESADDVGTQLGYLAGVMGTPDGLNQYYQRMSEVTPAQLQTFAKQYMTAKNRTTLTLSYKPAAKPAPSEVK